MINTLKLLLTTCIFVIPSCLCQAQVTSISQANAAVQLDQKNLATLANLQPTSSFQGFENPNLRLKGTPYMGKEWQEGRIRIAEGYSDTIGIALNIVDQILYVQLDNGLVSEMPNTLLRGLIIHNEDGTQTPLEVHDLYAKYEQGPRGYKYYQPLYKGDHYQFWELHTKYMRLEKYVENLGMVRRPNEFRSRYEYWLLDRYGNVRRMKKNMNSLLRIFPERANYIKHIVKKEKINIKEVEGLIRLVEFLEKVE